MAEVAQDKKKSPTGDDKVHTWPHLVRLEFIVAIFVFVVLVLWSVGIDAPLEEPANPTRTPNPSKAPWYFLGLQEMLVYFDPWLAGVVRWDPHKVVALTNVDLPYLLGFRDYGWSAVCGAVVVLGYFVVGLAGFYLWVLRVKGKEFLERWGLVRFLITAFLFVTMLSLPAKMFLRLAFNVKYILVTPWFNI